MNPGRIYVLESATGAAGSLAELFAANDWSRTV
jgi:hypothetical protein